MHISEFSVRNHVFPVMCCAAMLVFGWLGYREMGIAQYPEIDFPVVNITTTWESASPDIIDGDVTDVIENALSGVEGIDVINSSSSEGISRVTVDFHLRRDADAAMQDVQNAVGAAMSRLPADIDPPTINKVNRNRSPVMWLAVFGSRPINEINDFVDSKLKAHIETIPGCGGLFFGGLRSRNMRIWLDSRKLHAHDLDPRDVANALRQQSVERPAGFLESSETEMTVRTVGEARTAKEFEDIIVAQRNGALIRIRDVAIVEDGMTDNRGFARFNGIPNVGVGVLRARGANVVGLCDAVRERLPKLRAMLPPGMEIGISVDYSMFIRKDVEELKFALSLGVALTALVTYIFLGSFSSTLNIILAIPTSLCGAFFVMRALDFTINFMTLLGLSLSVGVVVDDAILVLENIYRRRENGEPLFKAAIEGAKQISFAALASTVSIVAIFLPVAFMEDAIGKFFFQFGVTVSVAVTLSLIVSLTLTPMLCSRFLETQRDEELHARDRRRGLLSIIGGTFRALDVYVLGPLLFKPTNVVLAWLTRFYAWAVDWSLRHKATVSLVAAMLAGVVYVFIQGINVPLPKALVDRVGVERISIVPLGRELTPSEDQNRLMARIMGPVGANIDYMDDMMRRCEMVLRSMPEFATFFSAISIRPGQLISEGVMFCRLVEREERTKTQTEVINELRARLGKVPGVRAQVMDLSTQGFASIRGFPVHFAVQGPDWNKVTQFSRNILRRMRESRAFRDVMSDYEPGMLELRLTPDRDRATAAGVGIRDLAFAVNAMVGGARVGRFTGDENKRYDVRLRVLADQRATPSEIPFLYVRANDGKLKPISDLVTFEESATLPEINRFNHRRKVEITANVAAGVSQGFAIAEAQRIASEILPADEGYGTVQRGNAKALQDTVSSLLFALVMGLVVAYMVLAVQFNSFVHPFTVLLALPFAATGALGTLWACGDSINLMSMIGLILLMGLVKKNSIILVDYINQVRATGLEVEEAVRAACPVRLRPILMTTLATMAGALPLAIGMGPGAETRAPLARGIIGGIAFSTLITLIVVPVFYVLFDRLSRWFTGSRNAARIRNETN